MLKRLNAFLIAVLLIFSILPQSSLSVLAEGEECFFESYEAESFDWLIGSFSAGGFTRKTDSSASGKYAMYPSKASTTTQPADTKPLYKNDISSDKARNVKLFIRVKGSDSIRFSVNGSEYKTKWFSFSPSEYTWEYLGEIELVEGNNTLSFAAYKSGLYLDKIILTDNLLYMPVGMGQNPTEKSGLSDTYPAPSFYPPSVHPRVFITPSDVSYSKSNLTHESNKAAYEKVKAYAKRTDTGILPVVNYNNYNNNALECAKANAYLYLLEGDESYAEKAVNIMINYMNTLRYVPSGSLMEMRGTGTAITTAAIVYDWCHDAESFSSEEKDALVMACLMQADKLECGWPSVNLSALNNDHGGENALMKDLFSFAIAVYDEYPEIYDFIGGRIFSEYVPSLNSHYEDESMFHRMGDNYGIYRFEFELYLALLLRGIGHQDAINPNQQYMAYQQIIRGRPDGATFRDGDIYNRASENGDTRVTASPTVAFYAAVLYKDPYLYADFKEICPTPSNISAGEDFSVTLYLALNPTDIPKINADTLPAVIYSGDESGILTARTSWEKGKNSNAMLVSMKLPEKYYGNHQHLDAGQFEIYYKGPLALDSGVYQSDPFYDSDGNYITSNLNHGSIHDYNYHKRTIAHNTILVFNPDETSFGLGSSNDGGQRVQVTYPHSTTLNEYINKPEIGNVSALCWGDDLVSPTFSYFKGDLTGWYSSGKMSDYKRSFVFLNFEDETYPGALIVLDEVESTNENYKKSWLLHSQEEPEISGNTTVIRRTENGYNGKLINQTLLPQNSNIVKVGGEGYEYYVNGKNYNAKPKSELTDESGNWRIEISPSEASKKDRFLNVLTVTENDDSIVPLNAALSESDKFFEIKIKDKFCFLGKTDEKISDSITLNTEGEGEFEYIVTNLSKGSWKIKTGSEEIIKDVSERGSALSFRANAGEIVLEKIDSDSEEISNYFGKIFSPPIIPEIETYPDYYMDVYNTMAFVKYMDTKGCPIKEFGFLKSESANSVITDASVVKYECEGSLDELGRYGIRLTGTTYDKKPYYLKPYLIYELSGKEKVVYAEALYIEFPIKGTERRIICSPEGGFIKDNTNVYSATEQDKANVFRYKSNCLNAFNKGASSPYSEYVPVVGYLQLDLSDFKNADFNRDIILSADSYFSLYDKLSTNSDYSIAEVSIYDASEFDWVNTDLSVRDSLADLSVIEGKSPIASVKASELKNPTYSNDGKTAYGRSEFNLTEYIKNCVKEGNYYPTICFYVSKPSTSDRILYRIRFNGTGANAEIRGYNTYIDYYTVPDLSPMKDTSVKSLKIGGEEINPSLFNKANTYKKYLPYGTTAVPSVIATAGEYSSVSVKAASSLDGKTEIKVTSAFGNTKVYYIEYEVSEKESSEYSTNLKWSGFITDSISGSVNKGESNIKPNLTLASFECYDAASYVSNISAFRLDLSKLSNADLSKDIILNLKMVGVSWDTKYEDYIYVSLYDISDSFNWATDGLTTSDSCQRLEPSLKNPLVTMKLPTSATAFDFNISELVRKCVGENNLNPTIALDIEFEEPATSQLRLNLNISYQDSSYANLIYSKFN